MSNSSIFLVHDSQERVTFHALANDDRPNQQQEEESQKKKDRNQEEESEKTLVSASDNDQETSTTFKLAAHEKITGEEDDDRVIDENDDGFNTPTSEEHKIPVVKECPPAPRKPMPNASVLAKRKLTFSRVCRWLDFSQEVELFFEEERPINQEEKAKKTRRVERSIE